MPEEQHRSIGEVLALLQGEFPEVTISKIRFLESQGLIDPERTPSGYRKFYDADIDRLRWILVQQRENYLPLKVIKRRLENGGLEEDVEPDQHEVGTAVDLTDEPGEGDAPGIELLAEDVEVIDLREGPEDRTPDGHDGPVDAAGHTAAEADDTAAALETSEPVIVDAVTGSTPAGRAEPVFDSSALTEIELTLDELIGASGLAAADVAALEQYGMLSSHRIGSDSYYDGDALVVARLAAKFREHGVEARHLRSYKIAAEREAGMFEQIVAPIVRHRSATSRADVADLLAELEHLGSELRRVMLRAVLGDQSPSA